MAETPHWTERFADQIANGNETGGDLSDAEVATRVRMLLRSDLDHEVVCVMARDRIARLSRQLYIPEVRDFATGVALEAAHQRERWGSDHDVGKAPADWFWLLGYLAGKALAAANAGDTHKALHHCISSAAALANWHAALSGQCHFMRPGIIPPEEN